MRFFNSWNIQIPVPDHGSGSVHVDLGCGRSPRNPLRAERVIGIDIVEETPGDYPFRFEHRKISPGSALPLSSSSVDSVSAYDFIEHIPRFDRRANGEAFNPFIELLNEVYRVLKPGGLFLAATPAVPSKSAFVDPTHVNFITKGTHGYFCEPAVLAQSLGYGFEGRFEALAVHWLKRWSPIWKRMPDKRETRFGVWSGVIRLTYEGLFDYRRRPFDLVKDAFSREHLLWVWRAVK